ncbi:hypothetical protein SNEBB_005665 [Seison nebaliae]|nr:hypothetical protein SNEBB_005665 [Seison nebaliae]
MSETEKQKLVSFREMYRYATYTDWLMLAIGTVMAVGVGAGSILNFLLYSDALDSFVAGDITPINGTNLTKTLFCNDTGDLQIILTSINDLMTEDEMNDIISDKMSDISVKYVYIAIATWIGSVIQIYCFSFVAEKQIVRIRSEFFRAILRQEIGWHDKHISGMLASRLTSDIDTMRNGMGKEIGLSIQLVSAFIFGYLVSFIKGWELTLVISTVMPLIIVVTYSVAIVIKKGTTAELEAYSYAGAISEEVLSNIKTVMSFGSMNSESKLYTKNLSDAEKAAIRKDSSSGLTLGLLDLLFYGSFSLSLWYGGKLSREKCVEYQAGNVIFIFFAALIGTFSLGQAGPKFPPITSARASAFYIFQLIDRKPEIDNFPEKKKGKKIDNFSGNITLDNVYFHYPTRAEVPILNGLNLSVKKGETVAFVGESGCGKSTIFQLIQRFYDTEKGGVVLDNTNIKDLDIEWVRENIGVVSQEPVLFATTIEDNVRYGRADISKERVIEACKAANIDTFIQQLPEKYDTLLGERGAKLSGGQKQRIAIARALIQNPKILLLDEATSALDTESERIVQKALDKVSTGRTTLIIAHRLSTIRNVDKIFGFQNGNVIESGSHDELVAKKGLYYSLLKRQEKRNEENESDEDDDEDEMGEPLETIIEDHESVISSADDEQMRTSESRDHKRFSFRSSKPVGRGSKRKLSRQNTTMSTNSSLFEADGRAHYLQKEWSDLFNVERAKIEQKKQDEEKNMKKAKEEDEVEEEEENGIVAKVKQLCKPKEKEEKEDLPTMKDILKYNEPEYTFIVLGIAMACLAGIVLPVVSIFYSKVLTSFAIVDLEEQKDEINKYAILLFVFGLMSFTGKTFRSVFFGISGNRLTTRLRSLYFKSIMRQEIGWFDRDENRVGILLTRLSSDVTLVQGMTGVRLGIMTQALVCVGGSLIVSFIYGPLLAIVLLLFFPFIFIAASVDGKNLSGVNQDSGSNVELAGQLALQSIDNTRIIYSLNAQKYVLGLFSEYVEQTFQKVKLKFWLNGAAYGLATSVQFFMFPVVFSYGDKLRKDGHMEFGDLFLVFTALTFGLMEVGQSMALVPDYNEAQRAAKRVIDLIKRKPLIDTLSEEGIGYDDFKNEKIGNTIPLLEGDLKLDNLRFRYPTRPNAKILRGINLDINKGEKIALVGESGCGKSTVIQLMERFYDPHYGHITIDGKKVRDLNVQWLRAQIGLVQQEPILFNRSIKDNIRYGKQNAKLDEVVEATKKANIHEFIANLPKGYETNVGAKGTQLSGGQKQRIAIARALMTDPSILLLDEATSALDTQSELIVQKALDVAMKGRTSICIAHRLSTIKDSDRIYVIGKGKVIEQGTHDELMALSNSVYANLYNAQTNK